MTQLAIATREKNVWRWAAYYCNEDANNPALPAHFRTASARAETAALREWDYWRAIERDCRLTEKEQAAKEDGTARAFGNRPRCIICNGHHTVGEHIQQLKLPTLGPRQA